MNTVIEPLFARYMFLNMKLGIDGDDWRPIGSTPGVSNIVRFGGIPGTVHSDLIDALKEEERDGIIDLGREYKEGDLVRIKKGMLENYVGIIRAKTGEERVILLLRHVGKEIDVDVRTIEPVE